MVYGDGSGHLFVEGALTRAIDVIGHEMAHGVTQHTAGLKYGGQPGALNESISDVFGSLVKQYKRGQSAEEADWLIGEGTLVPQMGQALRSMRDPGTAFKGDPQPGHMDQYVDLPNDNDPRNDNGGVHINSGIPNRAFFLAATEIGGRAWEKAGRIWYTALTERLRPDSDFNAAAEATVEVAGELFKDGSEQKVVEEAWRQVGVG
jgi:Zn-dependent metalloprotease